MANAVTAMHNWHVSPADVAVADGRRPWSSRGRLPTLKRFAERRFVPVAAMICAAEAVAGVLCTRRPYPWLIWLPLQAVGVSFVTAGVIAWIREPDNGTGRLMATVGLTWYLADLQTSSQPVLFAAGFCLFYLVAVVFTHMILALPTGHLRRRSECVLLAVMYPVVTVTQVFRYISEYPPAPQVWGVSTHLSFWAPLGSVAGGMCTLTAFGLVIRRWMAAGVPARRRLAALWSTGALVGSIALVWLAATLMHISPQGQAPLLFTFAVALIFTPFAILAGLLRVHLASLRVANLVVRLQKSAEPTFVRDALADALHDHSLQVGFPLPDGRQVDSSGRPFVVPDDDRRVTLVRRGGTSGDHLATLVHDSALADQQRLINAVAAAACLALDNARLHAEQRAQLDEVRASRLRIIAAADNERRRIQRDLHDGAQHKLLAISLLIGRIREDFSRVDVPEHAATLLAEAATQLRDLVRELRDLTEGIDPPTLTEQGLRAIVERLAEQAPIPVQFQVPAGRWPLLVERAAYFVIHEALTNVYKHANASQVAIRVTVEDEWLTVRIRDNGCGGADPQRGNGLRGLRDRVASIDGTFHIESMSGNGTIVEVQLPSTRQQ